jgi:hypothetical protein
MNTIGCKITSNYGLEVTVFNKIRNASDGMSIFKLNINWDRYLADHSPRFEFHVVLLNYTVVEINFYYLRHRDDV